MTLDNINTEEKLYAVKLKERMQILVELVEELKQMFALWFAIIMSLVLLKDQLL